MKFINETSASALFRYTDVGPDHLMACVVMRPTFVVRGQQLVETPEDPWREDSPAVISLMREQPPEAPVLKGGVDLFVLGKVWQLEGRPAPSLTMTIAAGPRFVRRIAVFGRRVWQNRDGRIVASDPEPFLSMPLTYDRAFGGRTMTQEGTLVWPANPEGMGLCHSAEDALGKPLPNLEDPDHLIARFEDRPEPVGTAPYPAKGSLRAMAAMDMELNDSDPLQSRVRRIRPHIFNQAHPRMVIPPADCPQPGDRVGVSHADPRGHLLFTMPRYPAFVRVQLEERRYVFPLHLDQIAIFANVGRVMLGYRVVFRYRMVKRERRSTTLWLDRQQEGAA